MTRTRKNKDKRYVTTPRKRSTKISKKREALLRGVVVTVRLPKGMTFEEAFRSNDILTLLKKCGEDISDYEGISCAISDWGSDQWGKYIHISRA